MSYDELQKKAEEEEQAEEEALRVRKYVINCLMLLNAPGPMFSYVIGLCASKNTCHI